MSELSLRSCGFGLVSDYMGNMWNDMRLIERYNCILRMTERQGGYFCTIDLKVEGKLLKLRVKKGDTFADLVSRLT